MLTKLVLSMITFFCTAVTYANFPKNQSTSRRINSPSKMDFKKFLSSDDAILDSAILNGAVLVSAETMPVLTPEIHELLKQISKADLPFEGPLLIFQDDQIIVTDPAKLDEVIAEASQTMTA